MKIVTHVLNEAKSPVEAVLWTMWCEAKCMAMDDGELVPPMDFYMEQDAAKSDCPECQKGFLSRERVEARSKVEPR